MPVMTRSEVLGELRSWLRGVPEEIRRGLRCDTCGTEPQVFELELRDDFSVRLAVDCHGRRFAMAVPAKDWDFGSNRPRKLLQHVVDGAEELIKGLNEWGTRPLPELPHARRR